MATVSQSTQWSVTLLCLLTTHSTVYWLVGQEEEEDSGLVLTTHQCSAVEGLVHSPAHSHQTPLTSHCTRILQELHSQGNSYLHMYYQWTEHQCADWEWVTGTIKPDKLIRSLNIPLVFQSDSCYYQHIIHLSPHDVQEFPQKSLKNVSLSVMILWTL